MENGKNRKRMVQTGGKRFRQRAGILFLAAALAVPAQIQAQEGTMAGSLPGERETFMQKEVQTAEGNRIEKELYHVHTGTGEEGSGCYTRDILHVHEGNPSEGGACYSEPVYHEHTGNESDGAGCYGEKKYHVHEGSEAEGGVCYRQAVYHSHTGSGTKGGGCYGTAVYHAHSGSAAKGGGCYGTAVSHTHSGSAAKGGGCYGKAVYHSHTGSASSGGGCYKLPVYHSHAGDSSSGGDCYRAVYHTHTDNCYTTEKCIATYEGGFQRIAEYDAECYHHGMTLHMTFEGTYKHQDCGLGKVTDSKTICWACNKMDIDHKYQKITCGKDEKTVEGYELSCGKRTDTVDSWKTGCNQNETSIMGYEINCGKNTSSIDSYQRDCGKNEKSVESYQINCGKSEKTVESYRRDCGKTEETIDSYVRNCGKDETVVDAYARSCQKTEETIDGHELGCGREENRAYAVFSLSNPNAGWSSSPIVLQAACEDKDGFLHLEEIPFSWTGGNVDMAEGVEGGVEEGTGEDRRSGADAPEYISDYISSCTVKENGTYTVRLLTKNDDISEAEPALSIEVRNIDDTAPVIREVLYDTEEGAAGNEVRVIAEDIQPDGSSGSGLAQKAYSFDGGKTWTEKAVYEVKENGKLLIMVRDLCGNISEKNIEISNIREEGTDGGDKSGLENENGEGKEPGSENKKDEEKPEPENEEGGEKPGPGNENGGDKPEPEDGGGEGNDSDLENEKDGESDSGSEGEKDSGDDSGQGSGENGEDNSDSQGGDEDDSSDAGGEAENTNHNNRKEEEKPQKKTTGGNEEAAGEKKQSGEARPAVAGKMKDVKEEKKETEKKEPEKKETEKRKTEDKINLPKKKEEISVKQQEVNAESVTVLQTETMKKNDVAAPVVKAVTFTVGSVAFAAVLLYLLYMMFRSIRVYHQDGEGASHYAGSCMMKKTENGFEVKLPDMIVEQSATGQFSLRPGGIFASRHKGEELLILAGERKEAVWIDKEIPFKLAVFV